MLFADFIHKTVSGCWLWKGTVLKNGMLLYIYRGKGKNARNVAFERFTKRELGSAKLEPKCKHPLCINPEHQRVIINASTASGGANNSAAK